MKVLSAAILLFLISIVNAEDYNYNGFLTDTAVIGTFRADSLKYSKPFLLSAYENNRVRVVFNDTTHAGFTGDSVKFYYFVQVGSPILNSSNKLDTAWNNNPVIVDTVDMLTAGNFTRKYSKLLDDGTFADSMKVIDTTSVTGFATNSHSISIPWDVFFRVGVKGLTGNKVGQFIKLRIDRLARSGVKVK